MDDKRDSIRRRHITSADGEESNTSPLLLACQKASHKIKSQRPVNLVVIYYTFGHKLACRILSDYPLFPFICPFWDMKLS